MPEANRRSVHVGVPSSIHHGRRMVAGQLRHNRDGSELEPVQPSLDRPEVTLCHYLEPILAPTRVTRETLRFRSGRKLPAAQAGLAMTRNCLPKTRQASGSRRYISTSEGALGKLLRSE
jgi:hypothetical protein